MNVYDATKTIILKNYDLNLGYLKEDVITKSYPEVLAVKEQGHYETINTYANGGKSVKWVVDIPAVSYQPAKIETEKIHVYITYSSDELAKKSKQKEIHDLQNWFDNFYAQHEQKYRRLIALGKLCDDGTNPTTNLTSLYVLAESNRAKINELEKYL